MTTKAKAGPSPADLIPREDVLWLRHVTSRVLIYGTLIAVSIAFLVPVYMVLVTSFKSIDQVSLTTMWEFPLSFTLDSFQRALEELAPNLFNSVVLVVPATAISAMLGSLNGYVLAKWRFPGAGIIFPLMLFGMFIPYQAILIPLVQFLRSICVVFNFGSGTCETSLYGNILGLILVHVVYGLPITTLIFRNYYAEVPTEMLEAGAIDGAGFFGLYRWIMFPISLPGFVVVIIWQFTQIWNEFLFGITLTSGTTWQPITVALQNLAGSQIVEWNVQMAGAFLTGLPTLVVYILLGRYFIRGLLAGSVKG
ncbi:MAG: carbohydrate ABC transporter permease [Anaerolineae bacterium]|nr:carbohydrate ABC transporter permease [Anaerolineae bacterium]